MRGVGGVVVGLAVDTHEVKVAERAQHEGLTQDIVDGIFLGGIVGSHGRGILDDVVGIGYSLADTVPDVIGGSSRHGVGHIVVLVEHGRSGGEVERSHIACYLGILQELVVVAVVVLGVGTQQTGTQTAWVGKERRYGGLALLIDGQEAVARGEQSDHR